MPKCGYVSIIGKPNVGKSTILNYLLGEKLSIVSRKPETTRDSILGITNEGDDQAIFIDTPGIRKSRHTLDKYMVKKAYGSGQQSDLILFVLDATSFMSQEDRWIFDRINDWKKNTILLINKVDRTKKPFLLPIIEKASKLYNFVDIIPISATEGIQMDLLKKLIFENLPEGVKLFPDEQFTDKSERFVAAEMIREKVLEFLWQEVPHSVAVLVEEMKEKERENITYIHATIYVERPSQKGIIIGEGGKMLKQIGQVARRDMEKFFGRKVYLDLWVTVEKDWRNNPTVLRRLGYS